MGQGDAWKRIMRAFDGALYASASLCFLLTAVMSEDLLPTAQCVAGLLALQLPMLLSDRLGFVLPPLLCGAYIVFVFGAIWLGEIARFYETVPCWDSVLHGISGVLGGFFGVMAVTVLNREGSTDRLSPFFIAAFAFSLALAAGAMWEIFEYTVDGFLGTNMQRWTVGGIALSGHDALTDTGKDLTFDALGALFSSTVGAISTAKGQKWLIPEMK